SYFKMFSKSKTSLNNAQKREFCLYTHENKMTCTKYIDWIEQKCEILNRDKKRNRSVTVPELEMALKEFVLTYQHKTVLSDLMLIEKAKLFADGLGVPVGTLNFSSGWLQKFKERNGIGREKLHGENESVNENIIIRELPLLRNKCSDYSLERIYNMDEIALFYQLEPDHSLAIQRLSGHKKNKECITVALCANADGSYKLNLLIIGKYAKPRCFKNVKISSLKITYYNSAKAWMLTTLFQKWLRDFDFQITKKHRDQPVLLILNQCSSHKPGWNEVIAQMIQNCWHYTRILPVDKLLFEVPLFNEPLIEIPLLEELFQNLNDFNFSDAMHIEEYLAIPEEDIVYEVPNEDKIIINLIETFRRTDSEYNENQEMADDSIEKEIISPNVALKSLENIHIYLLQQEDANEYIKLVNQYFNQVESERLPVDNYKDLYCDDFDL
ncbi:12389_t:CDS:2, partial [Dentiscutata erythropus]